jgi:hypothetical protein
MRRTAEELSAMGNDVPSMMHELEAAVVFGRIADKMAEQNALYHEINELHELALFIEDMSNVVVDYNARKAAQAMVEKAIIENPMYAVVGIDAMAMAYEHKEVTFDDHCEVGDGCMDGHVYDNTPIVHSADGYDEEKFAEYARRCGSVDEIC